MVERPALLHIDEADAFAGGHGPGKPGVDALGCGFEIALVAAERIVVGIEWRRHRPGLDPGEFHVRPGRDYFCDCLRI